MKKEVLRSPVCPWCDESKYVCGVLEPEKKAYEACEFRTLPKEKDAILKRMSEIAIVVKKRKEELRTVMDRKRQEEAVRDVLDKMSGVEVMAKCLEREFGIPKKKAFELAGFQGSLAADKLKVLSTMRKLSRGRS